MKRSQTFFVAAMSLVAACLCSTGCGKSERAEAPVLYAKDAIQLALPNTWRVEGDSDLDGMRHLIIMPPAHDAYLGVNVFSSEESPSLEEFAAFMIAETKSEIERSRPVESGHTFADQRRLGRNVLPYVESEFALPDDASTLQFVARYYEFPAGDHVVFFSTQAAAEDLLSVGKGFDLIMSSFKIE